MTTKIFVHIIGATLISLPVTGMEKQLRIQEQPVKIVNRTDQFHYARAKDLESIKVIAEIINLNAQEPVTGQTMLHYSVMLKDYQSVQYLLETDRIDTQIKNSSGRTVHDLARDAGLKDIKKLLEEYLKKQNSRLQ